MALPTSLRYQRQSDKQFSRASFYIKVSITCPIVAYKVKVLYTYTKYRFYEIIKPSSYISD